MIECELTKLKVGVPSDKEILYMNSKKCSYADVYTHTVCIKISKHMMFGDSEVKEAIPSIQTTNMSQKLDELDRERYATFNNSLQAFEDTIEVGSKRDLPEKDSSDGIKKKKI
jgi:two-component SAPR family response regulator